MNTEDISRKKKPLVFEKCRKKFVFLQRTHLIEFAIITTTLRISFFSYIYQPCSFTIIQWNLPVEQVFKGAVADSVTTFCGESRDCEITALRKRLLYHCQA